MSGIDGAKLLVVGASSGLGREVALAASARGADVAFSARRADRLEEAVKEAGRGCAVALDVSDEETISRGVQDAVDNLGGLDAVLYTAGTARLGLLADADAELWRSTLDVNLIGAALVAKAVVPHLAPVGGAMMLLSSTADAQPRWGLSIYGVTKTALNRLIDALRFEHKDVRFIRAVIGSTIGTEFGGGFDPELLGQAFSHWVVNAQHDAKTMVAPEVGQAITSLLDVLLTYPDIDMPQVNIEPAGGRMTLPATPEMAMKIFEQNAELLAPPQT